MSFVSAALYRPDHGFDPPHGSHQLPGLVLRVALRQAHVRFEHDKAFCLANVFR